MRRSRLLTVVLGALLALVLTPLLGAPGAAADPLRPDDARPADVGVAAVPRCTSWTTYYAANTTSYVVHVPSNGYNTGRYDCELRQGDQNDAVKVLQRALYYCTGATNVVIDGEYGPVTRAAVLAFQRRM